MRKITFITLLAAASFAAALRVEAQGLSQSDIMSACRADYMTHCVGVIPGGGRIINCLGEQMPRLSPGCRTMVSMGKTCLADYQRLCGSATPGPDVITCLKSRIRDVSEPCGKVLTATPQ